MNKETYEALKRIIGLMKGYAKNWKTEIQEDTKQVETWIDEVAKEYDE